MIVANNCVGKKQKITMSVSKKWVVRGKSADHRGDHYLLLGAPQLVHVWVAGQYWPAAQQVGRAAVPQVTANRKGKHGTVD